MMRKPTVIPVADTKPGESLILREARPFTMPDSRFEALGSSGGKLIAVLAGLMLAAMALLVCFAIVPHHDAGAATVPEETVAQKISDAGSMALADAEENDRDASFEWETLKQADAEGEDDASSPEAQRDESAGWKSGAEKLDCARTILSLG